MSDKEDQRNADHEKRGDCNDQCRIGCVIHHFTPRGPLSPRREPQALSSQPATKMKRMIPKTMPMGGSMAVSAAGTTHPRPAGQREVESGKVVAMTGLLPMVERRASTAELVIMTAALALFFGAAIAGIYYLGLAWP